MNWFRVYHDIIDDPKVLALPRVERWYLIELYAVASRQPERTDDAPVKHPLRGELPSMKEIAIHLRLSVKRAQKIVELMMTHGFIDASEDWSGFKIHGWDQRQFRSDNVSTRSRESMQRSRERSQQEPVNVHVNVPDTETDTETDKKTPHTPRKRVVRIVDFELPDWIPENDWNDWLEMRKAKRAPTTHGAMIKAVKSLDKLRAEGHLPSDVLQQSVLRAWTGVFPVAQPYQNGANGKHDAPKKTPKVITPEEEAKASEAYKRTLNY